MGLVHSHWQGDFVGTWRFSRGHAEEGEFHTIMSYQWNGSRPLLVFSDPSADCEGAPCGVSREAPAAADAVTSLNAVRYQFSRIREAFRDSDGDGHVDPVDALPEDATEWRDTDGDGVGNNSDTDDDGDGIADPDDAFPSDAGESRDTDDDGIGDNADTDDDGDGREDSEDAFPLDPTEWLDTDRDGAGDHGDADDDGDGVYDDEDAFPLDPAEWADTDGDGLGNNSDADDDGDGVGDSEDALPLNPTEWTDSDGDGAGNRTDAFPDDPAEWLDTDGDGVGNNADTDDDGDGVPDAVDALPMDPAEHTDTDGDGIGDRADRDADNDGVPDVEDRFPSDPGRWDVLASYKFVGEQPRDGLGSESRALHAVEAGGGYLLMGARRHDHLGLMNVGTVYLVARRDLATLDLADGHRDRVIHLSHLGQGEASWKLVGHERGQGVGLGVVSTGDMDGDGLIDVAISQYSKAVNFVSGADLPAADAADGTVDRVVEVRLAVARPRSFKILGDQRYDLATQELAIVPDRDGDDLPELLLSAPPRNSESASDVFLLASGDMEALDAVDGHADRTIRTHNIASGAGSYRFVGAQNGDGFGNSVAVVGDVDGDAVADLLLGAENVEGVSVDGRIGGAVYLVSGARLRELDLADGAAEGVISMAAVPAQSDSYLIRASSGRDLFFGRSVSPAGDVDGDGRADILIDSFRARHLLTAASLESWDALDGSLDGRVDLSRVDWAENTAGPVKLNRVYDYFSTARAVGGPLMFNSGSFSGSCTENRVGAYVLPFSALENAERDADGIVHLSRLRVSGNQGYRLNQTERGPFTDSLGEGAWGGTDIDGDGVAELLIGASRTRTGGSSNSPPGVVYLLMGPDLEKLDEADGAADRNVYFANFAGDTDGDGTSNAVDADDDGDGVPDSEDAFQLDAAEWSDWDGDCLGDHSDTDDDNDGVADADDAFPRDAEEWQDSDGDGVGNNADPDDDGDGVGDAEDAFPLDATESVDTDGDGVGNNADAFPEDPLEVIDSDGDGIGDNADPDDDNDGTDDADDALPLDPTETVDTDGDGVGDNADAFPEDPSEVADTDGDGVGDNADAFPENPAETADADGDGVGDNADTDDDNDGIEDDNDTFPLDPSEWADADADGVGDNADRDTDGDGIVDGTDAAHWEASMSYKFVAEQLADYLGYEYGGTGESIHAVTADGGHVIMGAPIHRYSAVGDSDKRIVPGAIYIIARRDFAVLDVADGQRDRVIHLANVGHGDSSWKLVGQSRESVGTALASSGDMDGDGWVDVVVGGFQGTAAYFVSGADLPAADAKDGSVDHVVELSLATAGSRSFMVLAEPGEDLGRNSLAVVPDRDGDGLPELLFGATAEHRSESHGSAYLLASGDVAELDAADGERDGVLRANRIASGAASWRLVSEQAEDGLGESVAAAGDLDGDGVADLLLGARSGGETDGRGRAYLLSGSELETMDLADGAADGVIGLAAVPARRNSYLLRDTSRDDGKAAIAFGGSVSATGDVDGDGRADLMIDSFSVRYLLTAASLPSSDAADGRADGRIDLGRAFWAAESAGSARLRFRERPEYPFASVNGTAQGPLVFYNYEPTSCNDVTARAYLLPLNVLDDAERDTDGSIRLSHLIDSGTLGYRLFEAERGPFTDRLGLIASGGTDIDGDGASDVLLGENRWGVGPSGIGPNIPTPGVVYLLMGSDLDALDRADGLADRKLHFANFAGDTDGDGLGNAVDADDDGDGVPDHADIFQLDAGEWSDWDGDCFGDNSDTDDDNDGVPDSEDAFPRDATEWQDSDGDGIGDNADPDDDGDGVDDAVGGSFQSRR